LASDDILLNSSNNSFIFFNADVLCDLFSFQLTLALCIHNWLIKSQATVVEMTFYLIFSHCIGRMCNRIHVDDRDIGLL